MLIENEKASTNWKLLRLMPLQLQKLFVQKKIRPRAIVFKANQKDFDKIREFIKSQLPDVEIVYVTTGPAACILRVAKSMPFELQDSFTQTFYTAE